MGLLDNFSSAMDDPVTMGLLGAAGGILNASGPSLMPHSLGQVLAQGLQGGLGGYKGAQDEQRQKMQMEMLKQQVAQATRKNELVNNMLGRVFGAQGAQPSPTSSAIAEQALSQGAGIGDVGPTTSNALRMQQLSPAPMAQTQSAPFGGVSPEAIGMDLAFNDGKGVGGWINDRTKPNMQVHNGFAVNMNGLQPGFLPQLNVSQNGQTSMVTIGPDGLPTVSAPAGAIDTVKGYAAAGEQAKNENTLAPLDRINPRTGRPYNMTVQQLINAAASAGSGSDQFRQLPPDLQATLIQQGKSGPGPTAFDFTGPNGTRLKGDVPQGDTGFAGFAGPTDLAAAAERVKQQFGPRTAYDTATSSNMAEYEKGLNGRVSSGQDLMMRINEARDALTKFQAGGGMEVRQQLAKAAQAIGAPNGLVDRIAGGDLSAAQEFQKLSAQQAMEALKQAMGGSGRISQAEFKVFQQNNPNLDTDPRAIEKVFNFATNVYKRDKAEQDALAKYKGVPGADISAFPNWWAGQSGIPAETVTGGALGTQPATSAPGKKVATLSDIATTARASGKSTAQVTADLKARGYTIGGQ